MKLTVLGCSTPLPKRDMPCSGYLISDQTDAILLDCGSGVFPALADHIDPRELSAVWISHMHPDHCADLITLANWALNATDKPRVRVLGPQGWDTRLNAFISNDSSVDLVRDVFDVDYLTDGRHSTVGGFDLTSRLVRHSVPSYGVRISRGRSTFAYSGDSGPCRSLEQLSENVDTFLCEAGSAEPSEYHMTIRQAYDLGCSARVGRLLLTHIPDEVATGGYPLDRELRADVVNVGDEWFIAETR